MLSTSLLLLDAIPPFWSCQYWVGVFQNAIGCTIGSLAAIAAAYLIYWLTNKHSRIDRAQEAKDLLIYFKGLVANVIQIAKNQTSNIEAYCLSIQEYDLQPAILRFLPMYNLKKIAEGDSMDRILIAYIRAFPGPADAIDFSNLISKVEYLYSQFLQLPEELNRTMIYDHERKMQLKRIFQNAYALLREYTLQAEMMDPTNLFDKIQHVVDQFNKHSVENYDIAFFNQYFFVPLNDILHAELVDGDPLPVIVSLSHLTREGASLFLEIKSQNQGSRRNMLEIIPSLQTAISQLETHASKVLAFT